MPTPEIVRLIPDGAYVMRPRVDMLRALDNIWPGYPKASARLSLNPEDIAFWLQNGRYSDYLRGMIKVYDKPEAALFTHPNYMDGLRRGRAVRDNGRELFHGTQWLPSFHPVAYSLDSRGLPVHPYADFLLEIGAVLGPGFYWTYGPNRTADPVVLAKFKGRLYWLAIRRADFHDIVALPGGHEEPDSVGVSAALRELFEETGIKLGDIPHEEVYRGLVPGDNRVTLNSWPESRVFLFMPDSKLAHALEGQFRTQRGETKEVLWVPVSTGGINGTFASHADFIKLAVLKWQQINDAVIDVNGIIHQN